jgi:hypothetical protein
MEGAMPRALATAILCIGLAAAAPAAALSVTYSIPMTGAEEVPGPGDADGSAGGTITLDDGTGAISWSLTYANIDAPTAMHIHAGAAGQANPPLVDLGVATSGGAGTLISSTTASTATVASILADPTAFYVNIHNTAFPGGAVRGQLGTAVPEPAAAALLAGALAAWALRRRAMR